MQELLQALIAQNGRMVELLEDISVKLDKLDEIDASITSLSHAVDSVTLEVNGVQSEVGSILEELQWHEGASFAAQVLQRFDDMTNAIDSQ